MELYGELGDNLALQYGGSEAHKKVSSSSGPGKQVSVQVEGGMIDDVERVALQSE